MTKAHRRLAAWSVTAILLMLTIAPVSQAAGARGTAPDNLATNLNAQPLQVEIDRPGVDFVPDELIVKLDSGSSLALAGGRVASTSESLAEMVRCLGFKGAEEVFPGTYRLSAPEGAGLDVQAAAEALRSTEGVAYAAPNHIYQAMVSPNDQQYVAGQQWGVTQIKAEQAWDITTGSSDIVIAIVDTGTAPDHPDLEGKLVRGYDFDRNDDDPRDENGHGTYTAGIAGAASNNGLGVVGIAWGARIMPIRVLSASGSGEEINIALGIRWAVDNGARIVSASLGGDEESPAMLDAVQYAHDRNVLVVAAAGNTPDGKPHYPAAYDTVLAVGATGRSDTFTGFSSWGSYVDVTAPGVGILSTGWDGGTLGYEYGNGTSASCPFVSGVAALVWTVNPALTADQVKQIIEDSSDDLGDPGWDEHYGRGRLNAQRAVQMAQQGPPVPRTATPEGQPSPTVQPTATAPAGQATSLQVSTTNVSPGALLSIVGVGFGPNEFVDLRLTTADGNTQGIGNAQTTGQGTFAAEVALPGNAPLGNAKLEATGSQSGRKAGVDLTIAANAGNGGKSVVRGTVTGGTPDQTTVRLKPALGVAGPEMSAQPDGNGAYTFSGLSAGIYSLSAATGGAQVGPWSVQVDGTELDVKTVNITVGAPRPEAFNQVAPSANTPTQVYFQPVGHTLKGPFLNYWQQNGGLAIFGYPISEEFQEVSQTDGKTYTVQYFERNRFEHHPEFAGTTNEVLMGLLGVDTTHGRTFPPSAPFLSDANNVYFPETQHSLSGPFLTYWQQNGGLAIFGYPISEELIEDGYRVQYFERNRFEHHPEYAGTTNEVLLGLLGVEVAKRNGWIVP